MNTKTFKKLFVGQKKKNCGIRQSVFGILRLMLFLSLALALLSSCQQQIITGPEITKDIRPVGDNTARLSLFLSLKDPNGPGIRLDVKRFEVLVNNSWLPLNINPITLNSREIGATQIFLGGQWLMPGMYHGLRFTVTQSSFLGPDGNYKMAATEQFVVSLDLSAPLSVAKDGSQSLFITWNVRATLDNTVNLNPVMTIAPPLRQFLFDLVYVACPDIDTVFVIRCDKNWVVDSFGIRGQPTYLALNPDPSNQLLYVLAARESRIKVVELNSQRVIDSFPIPLTENPSFMTISPDGQWVYVLDENERYLSRLELATGTLMARVHLNYPPQYATYLGSRNLLAVSFLLSQAVTYYDPLDLTEVASVQTGDAPDGLLASVNRLYIAESGSNTLSIIDIPSNTTESRIMVGFTPRRVLNIGGQIYVSNYDNGSISLIYPGQSGVGREIPGLGHPLEMVFDQTNRWIYAGDEQRGGLAVIDYRTNQLRGYINLGTRPLGMAIIQ